MKYKLPDPLQHPKEHSQFTTRMFQARFKSFKVTLLFPKFCYSVWNLKLANDCKPEIQHGMKMRITVNLLVFHTPFKGG